MLGGGLGRGAEFQVVGYHLYTQDRAVTSVIVTLIQEAQEGRVKLRLPKKVHQQTMAKVFSHWAKNLVIRQETSHWANNLITNNTIVVLPPVISNRKCYLRNRVFSLATLKMRRIHGTHDLHCHALVVDVGHERLEGQFPLDKVDQLEAALVVIFIYEYMVLA